MQRIADMLSDEQMEVMRRSVRELVVLADRMANGAPEPVFVRKTYTRRVKREKVVAA
jgi:hypothetical protein